MNSLPDIEQSIPLYVAVDEGIDIAIKQQLSEIDDADPLSEDLAKMKLTDEFQVPVEQKISPNGDDVDADFVLIKPQRIRKKKKQIVTRTKQGLALNFKLLEEYPGSFFMVVRCKGCFFVTNIFSHTQEPVPCRWCFMCLFLPGKRAGGRGKVTGNCSFWAKTDGVYNGYLYDDNLPPNYWEDAKRCKNHTLKPC